MNYPLPQRTKELVQGRQKFFKQLSNSDSDRLDAKFHKGHELAFKKIDCLDCANCCKNHSPIPEQSDLIVIAQAMGIDTKELLLTYIEMDEDGDFVFKSQPCPLLNQDNSCSIYENRPLACRDYPHTNRKHMNKILDITEINSFVCPAVDHIVRHWEDL